MFLLAPPQSLAPCLMQKKDSFITVVVFFVLLRRVVFFLQVDIKTNTFLIVAALVNF